MLKPGKKEGARQKSTLVQKKEAPSRIPRCDAKYTPSDEQELAEFHAQIVQEFDRRKLPLNQWERESLLPRFLRETVQSFNLADTPIVEVVDNFAERKAKTIQMYVTEFSESYAGDAGCPLNRYVIRKAVMHVLGEKPTITDSQKVVTETKKYLRPELEMVESVEFWLRKEFSRPKTGLRKCLYRIVRSFHVLTQDKIHNKARRVLQAQKDSRRCIAFVAENDESGEKHLIVRLGSASQLVEFIAGHWLLKWLLMFVSCALMLEGMWSVGEIVYEWLQPGTLGNA